MDAAVEEAGVSHRIQVLSAVERWRKSNYDI